MASGDTLCQFFPQDNEPPTSNYATLDFRNSHPVLDFDQSTDESAIFTGVLPQHYGGGGLTAKIHWSASGVTTGNCIWDVSIERIGTGIQDVDSDGFDTINSVTDAAPATDGDVEVASVALTNMDSLAVGELFRLKITRDANNASDTMTADAELHAIELQET